MIKDKDIIAGLYDQIITENITPLAVKGGDGTKPGDLPSDAASTTETQKGTGSENAKNITAPEEAEEKLNPVKKDKGTTKTASKKQVTAIKDSVQPRKSFMELFDQVMVKEEGDGIEDSGYDDEQGDFPEPEGEVPVEGEVEELGEGEIYSQLSDLFSQLAGIKGAGMGEEEDLESEDGMEEMEGMEGMPESFDRYGNPIQEMRNEPEPREFSGNHSERQLPNKLAGNGVRPSSGKAATKGSDKKRTGELEDAPAGFRHDKSKFRVKGTGSAHKAANASFLED
jgi:hypothetical protein